MCMKCKEMVFTESATTEISVQRLMELAGIDGARDLQANKEMPGQQGTNNTDSRSWEDGVDEFDPDKQDINGDHRGQEIEAIETALDALGGLRSLIATTDATDPHLNNLETELNSFKETLEGILNGLSYPEVEAPDQVSPGKGMDPSQNGPGAVG